MNRLVHRFTENYNRRKAILREKGLFDFVKSRDGYVLLIVLVLTTFIASFTAEFFLKTNTYISALKKTRAVLACEYLGVSGFEIAKSILDVDRLGLSKSFLPNLNSDKAIDTYQDIWALDFPEIPFTDNVTKREIGTIKIIIEDENSKININAIISEFAPTTKYYGILQRFFVNMGHSMDLADTIMDWVDPDDSRFPYGAETSNYYANLSPSYTAKNGPADSIDELLLVKGFTPDIYYGLAGGNYGLEKNLVDNNKGVIIIPEDTQEEINQFFDKDKQSGESEDKVQIGKEKDRRLASYLRVYGDWKNYPDESSKLNINTMSYRVLMSLSDDITEDKVTDIITKRQLQPFRTKGEIENFTGKDNTINGILTVKSYIFKITIISSNANGLYKSVYYYDRENKKILYYSGEY